MKANCYFSTGLCIDGDSHALSAIRVMEPCIAMSTVAAYALDLADVKPVYDINLVKFQAQLHDNPGCKD